MADDFLDARLTERRNPRSQSIDTASALELVDLINAEDATVPAAVAKAREPIARTIELVVQLRFEPKTGRRRLVSIFEVTGLEGSVITGQELWALHPERDRLAQGPPERQAERGLGRGREDQQEHALVRDQAEQREPERDRGQLERGPALRGLG